MKDLKKLHKFLDEVLHRTFSGVANLSGPDRHQSYPSIRYVAPSKFEDECIAVDSLEVRLTDTGRWNLSVIIPIPGVMYHSDGSGTPDDVDVLDIGNFDSDTELVRKIAETLLSENLSNAISEASIAAMMEEEEQLTSNCTAREMIEDRQANQCAHLDRNMNGGCDCGDPSF